MSYKVTAPLVIIANADGKGGDWYGYADAIVPPGLNDERCKQLVKEGMLVEVEDDPEDAGPPAKSANKADWIAHAVSQGMSEEDANAATKDELVEQYS